MQNTSNFHHRRSIRLKEYDYALPGYYFVTLLAHEREHLFGEIVQDEMHLNLAGECAQAGLMSLSSHFDVLVDTWVVMPDHIHIIIALLDAGSQSRVPTMDMDRMRPKGTQLGSLGAVIQNYKSLTTYRINAIRHTPHAPVWHRNYYERIIRDDQELEQTQAYIMENPKKWAEDQEKLW